ncbi:hypothetical protein Mal64_21930 [Pseudobythopirellula maris]|uniref:Bacterial type II and III secretion system protein n=1 Tax=Pseudobythopirellula maris TaxID=2527991 RepID=A0A5C5ZNQ4_9BACT|nr:hypothetical protein [Pseudobythopirellula maris]TWT88705.1 hypothetical protein Mal64_21930 [Pseudobythopirellula maris]
MRRLSRLPAAVALATIVWLPTLGVAQETAPPAEPEAAETDAQAEFKDEVMRLVRQLDARRAGERAAAFEGLVALAGPTSDSADRLLAALPRANDRMPPAVRAGLARVQREVETRVAQSSTVESRVTLDVEGATLAEVATLIEEQTGNRLADNRGNFGQNVAVSPITASFDDRPFWEAVDSLLDTAGLTVYNYGGDDALALVGRDDGARQRVGSAAYAGPFRFEPLRVVAVRSLRNPTQNVLNVELEVAWEPRLRPIALSVPLSELTARTASDARLSMLRPEQSIDVEVTPGSKAVEMTLPLVLPDRETDKIASLSGVLRALAPARRASFRFEELDRVLEPKRESRGGVTVTLERFFENNSIWELHMRLRLDDAQDALASHRGWVFQNTSYLVDEAGERIEHAGFETLMQTETEVGVAYLFDLPTASEEDSQPDEGDANPAAGYSWVYESPAGIVRTPIEFKIESIPLP